MTSQIYVFLPKNNDIIRTLYKLGGYLDILSGINLPGIGAVASQIFLQHVYFGSFYVYSIVPCPTTPPIWQMFPVLLVHFDHMHIWKVSGCSKHGPIPFFNVVVAYF